MVHGNVTLIFTLALIIVFSPFIAKTLKLPTTPIEIILGSIFGYVGFIHNEHLFEIAAEIGFFTQHLLPLFPRRLGCVRRVRRYWASCVVIGAMSHLSLVKVLARPHCLDIQMLVLLSVHTPSIHPHLPHPESTVSINQPCCPLFEFYLPPSSLPPPPPR